MKHAILSWSSGKDSVVMRYNFVYTGVLPA